MKTIKLHLGAHKTATTYLQHLLNNSRDYLLSNKIRLSLPDDLRPVWLPLLKSKQLSSFISEQEVISADVDQKIWIFSEENFPGNPKGFLLKPESLYPELKNRLSYFVDVFPEWNIEVFLSIRSYETYYRSVYLEVVRNNGYVPFEDFYHEALFRRYSWADTVKEVVSVVGSKNVILWCYEDFDRVLPEVLQKLTGLEEIWLLMNAYQSGVTRASFSEKALFVMRRLSSQHGQEKSKAFAEIIGEKYAVARGYKPFEPFSLDQARYFREKYRQDINSIIDRYPEINKL